MHMILDTRKRTNSPRDQHQTSICLSVIQNLTIEVYILILYENYSNSVFTLGSLKHIFD